MGRLSAHLIAQYYTVDQITEKITELQSAYDSALTGEYRLDTTAGSQRVAPPDPAALSRELSVWMKAYQIKTGNAPTRFICGEYKPTGGPV